MQTESVHEFANRLRARYSAYYDKNDEDLVQRYLLKHPEYRKRVSGGFSYPKALGIEIPGLAGTEAGIRDEDITQAALPGDQGFTPELSELMSQSIPTGAPPPFAPAAVEPPKTSVVSIL